MGEKEFGQPFLSPVMDEFKELATSERLADLLNDVSANSELAKVLDSKIALDYVTEALKGFGVVDYLIGYKPAAFVRESEDELGVTVLTDTLIFEFVFGPGHKRYDMTPLRDLSWIKLDEKEQVDPQGKVEPYVKFEAIFGFSGLRMDIHATGDKGAKLKGLAEYFRRFLARSSHSPVVRAWSH